MCARGCGPGCPDRGTSLKSCPLRARSAGRRRVLTVTPGQPDTPAHLRTGRLTRCANRPVTKLLALPVTVWNRRRCLLLAQRGQCPSDKPVGDHGGSLAYSRRVSLIRGSHVSGMQSSKPLISLVGCPFRAENRGWPLPADAATNLIVEVVSKPGAGSQLRAVHCRFEHED